ncbi:MAG TPA: hypothetical protein DCO79_09870 [Spirochaeta sp.]|nr:hypothetical protein [Spirochaeta sp.]
MKRRRISDKIDFTPEEQVKRKKIALLGFPIFSIVLAFITAAPILNLIARGRELSTIAYIPLAFGALLLYNGVKQFIRNRKAIVEAFSKADKTDDTV